MTTGIAEDWSPSDYTMYLVEARAVQSGDVLIYLGEAGSDWEDPPWQEVQVDVVGFMANPVQPMAALGALEVPEGVPDVLTVIDTVHGDRVWCWPHALLSIYRAEEVGEWNNG